MRPHHGARKVIRKTLLILSIVGFIVSLGLWIRSNWQYTQVFTSNQLQLYKGELLWSHWLWSPTQTQQLHDQPKMMWRFGWSMPPSAMRESKPDLEIPGVARLWHRSSHWTAAIKLWLPTLFFAACATCILRSLLRHRGVRLCQLCGYDLRGSADICPECGKSVGATGSAS